MSKAILWVLENTPVSLSARQLADHIAAEGGVFQDDDVMAQWRRVNEKLRKLRSKGVVQSCKVKGHVAVWSMRAEFEKHGAAARVGAVLRFEEAVSEGDWALIRKRVPASARHEGAQSQTRRFIELVLTERATEGTPRFTPKQRKRFLAWFHLGVWADITDALGGRLEYADFTKLAARLELLQEPRTS